VQSSFNNNNGALGGGVYINTNGLVTITSSNFTGNHATTFGGGLALFNAGNITNCTFTNNKCDIGSGGGLYASHHSGKITNTFFIGNQAMQGGGVYSIFPSPSHSFGLGFESNLAQQGGGIYIEGSIDDAIIDSFDIQFSYFTNNTAFAGAGMFVNQITDQGAESAGAFIYTSQFYKNNGLGPVGSGLYVESSSTFFGGSYFIDNTATQGKYNKTTDIDVYCDALSQIQYGSCLRCCGINSCAACAFGACINGKNVPSPICLGDVTDLACNICTGSSQHSSSESDEPEGLTGGWIFLIIILCLFGVGSAIAMVFVFRKRNAYSRVV